MGYALLWVEFLAVALLWTAFGVACAGLFRRRLWQNLVATLFTLVPVSASVLATVAAGFDFAEAWWSYALSGTIGVAVGAGVLLFAGLKRSGEPPVPAAAEWMGPRLAFWLGTAVVLLLATIGNLDTSVRLQISALRSESGALALSVAPPRVADRANAALFYERAFELMGKMESWPQKFDAWRKAADQPSFTAEPACVEFLRRQEPALAMLRRAAAMPDCVFEHEYARPSMDMLLPELAFVRRAAQLLALNARTLAANGRMKEALADVASAYGIARHLRTSNPVLIAFLVADAADRIASGALERVLATGKASAADLAQIQTDEPLDFKRAVVRSLRMEEAFGLGAFCEVMGDIDSPAAREIVGGPSLGATVLLPLARIFLFAEDFAGYRRLLQRSQELASRPYYEAAAEWQGLDAEVQQHPSGILTRMLVPALTHVAGTATLVDAQHRLAMLAVALESYRADAGRWPERIEDLVPAKLDLVPTDPFDGKPLRMVAADGGLKLYSVGPDGKDEGGAAFDETQRTGDVTFRVCAAEAKGK